MLDAMSARARAARRRHGARMRMCSTQPRVLAEALVVVVVDERADLARDLVAVPGDPPERAVGRLDGVGDEPVEVGFGRLRSPTGRERPPRPASKIGRR